MKQIVRFMLPALLAAFVTAGSAFAADQPAPGEGIVDVNTATVEQLLSIPETNMTKELAQAVVDYRTKNGAFKFTDDLLRVPGMSNEVWQKMQLIETEDGKVVYDPNSDEMTFAPSKC